MSPCWEDFWYYCTRRILDGAECLYLYYKGVYLEGHYREYVNLMALCGQEPDSL
jgi:hypothetical protein